MEKHKRYQKAGIVLLVLILLAVSGIYMGIDRYMVGDEIVTYGMADSTDRGWMLSTGRIRAYFEGEILEDSVSGTVGNIIDFGMDIVKNKKSAAYFSYPRPEETGWYANGEISDWFEIKSQERFSFGDVYLNAMGDDANSYLYYMLVHLSGSLFPGISGTKWSAWLVNAVALIAAILILYQIAGYFLEDKKQQFLVCLLFGLSVGCLDLSTYLRAYMVTMALQLALLLLHLKLYEGMKKGDTKRTIVVLLIIYPLGYIAHYTTGLWAAVLGIATIIYIQWELPKRDAAKYTRQYIGCGALAILLGIALDPMSVLGLVSKLSGTGKTLGEAVPESAGIFVYQVFGSVWLFIIFLLVFAYNLILHLRGKDKALKKDKRLVGLEWLLAGYSIVIVVLTKFAYFKVVYPLMFLVILMEAAYFVKNVGIRRWLDIACLLLAVVFVGNSLVYTYHTKKSEVQEYDAIAEALREADTDRLLLIRSHAEGYECFPLLKQYENVFVLTMGEEELDVLLGDEGLADTQDITVLNTNTKADGEAFLDWVSDNGIDGEFKVLHEAGKYEVLKWEKQ